MPSHHLTPFPLATLLGMVMGMVLLTGCPGDVPSASPAAPSGGPARPPARVELESLEPNAAGLSRWRHPKTGIVLVGLPGATFTMGLEGDTFFEEGTQPVREVSVSAFRIGETEVTNAQFRRFRPEHDGPDDQPAVNVTWHDAKAFCDWAGLALPTEAEWEYACRGGTKTFYFWGDEMDGAYLWWEKNSGGTVRAVAGKKPNPFGLYDMLGNVWEWCADWKAPYDPADTIDPKGPASGEDRAARGGAATVVEKMVRCASRDAQPPDDGWELTGFRVVLRGE